MVCPIVLVIVIGRVWEYSDPNNDGSNKPVNLPLSDGGQWWQDAINTGYYQTGQTPALGAVICFSDDYGGSGHVGIVEEIDVQTGEITVSNSAWQSTYFFLTHILPDSNGKYNWSHYTFQGFIYCYEEPPIPPTPTSFIKRKFPWVIYARKLREKRT